MAHWLRFEHDGQIKFGTLHDDAISIHSGDMFSNPANTGETVELDDVRLVTPCDPSKMVCLWNNFRALTAKMEVDMRK